VKILLTGPAPTPQRQPRYQTEAEVGLQFSGVSSAQQAALHYTQLSSLARAAAG